MVMPMNIQNEVLEALRALPPVEQRKVLDYAHRLQHDVASDDSLFARADRLGAVGIVTDAPADLSTAKRHFAGFGRD
jgi:hypothetical protein